MKNLVALIRRYSNFFLFFFLQLVCIGFLVTGNDYHRASFSNSASSLSGWINKTNSGWTDYFALDDINDQLLKENAYLRSRVFGSDTIAADWNGSVDSTARLTIDYKPANVISLTTQFEQNFLTLDIGSSSGVERGMGVVGPQGIVGFVRDVSNSYCTVVSIMHNGFQLGVIHGPSGQYGNLKWSQSDNEFGTATIEAISNHIELKAGDSIFTKGGGFIFPRGEHVGLVKDFEKDAATNHFRVIVELGTDYNNVYRVHVVRLKDLPEIKILQDSLNG